jgi:hypothetical protein
MHGRSRRETRVVAVGHQPRYRIRCWALRVPDRRSAVAQSLAAIRVPLECCCCASSRHWAEILGVRHHCAADAAHLRESGGCLVDATLQYADGG